MSDEAIDNKPVTIDRIYARNSQMSYCDLSGSRIVGVSFANSVFDDCNFGNCSFHNVGFGKSIITHACFADCEIPHGNIGDLKIAGVAVRDLLDAYKQVHGRLPDPGHHDRH